MKIGQSKEPLVSIVIPVYNGGNYLATAIDSALSQTYPHCEVIVVNDGSEDGGQTAMIARHYGGRIRYFEKANGGVASALNAGIQKMRGDYFAWLSHDDTFAPEKIAWQMERIRASGDPMTIAQANYTFENVATGAITRTRYDALYGAEQVDRGVFLLFWTEEHFSNLLFHRAHFDRVGLFDEGNLTAQDQEMQFRLMRGRTTVFEPRPVSRVRMHARSGTHTMHARMLVENRKMYLDAFRALTEAELVHDFGAARTIYCHVAAIVRSMGGGTELAPIEAMLEKSLAVASRTQRIEAQRAAGGLPPVMIFGAGQYGRRLRYELAARGVTARCYLDNDPQKDGTTIDGIPCVLPERLSAMPDGIVVVAQRLPTDALAQARDLTPLPCLTKYEADAWLFRHPPICLPDLEDRHP